MFREPFTDFGVGGFDTRSQKAVSSALRSALLESICVTLSKLPPGSFPITPSIFYERYILPYRSPQLKKSVGAPVNVKHSGFKSLTAFLKASTKEGLIRTKKTKEGVVITGVNESHPSVRAHVHHVTIKDTEARKGGVHGWGREMEGVQEISHKPQVTFLQKPVPVSAPFFQHIGRNPKKPLTKKEIKNIITRYLTSKHLFKLDDPKFVNVVQDEVLLDTVLSGKESDREELLEQKFMDTDEVISRIVESTEEWYRIHNDREPIVRKATPRPVSVSVTRRRNHTVTCASGFENFQLDADSLVKGLNTTCASSTTVQPNPHNPKWKQIMVQGEHTKVIKERLIAGGIPRQWIKVIGKRVGRTKFVNSSRRGRFLRFRYRRTGKIRRWERTETSVLGKIARQGICQETIKLNPSKGGKKREAGKTRQDGKGRQDGKERQDGKKRQDDKKRWIDKKRSQASKKQQASKKHQAIKKQEAGEVLQSGNRPQVGNGQQGGGKQQNDGGQRASDKQQTDEKQQTRNKRQGGKKRQAGK